MSLTAKIVLGLMLAQYHNTQNETVLLPFGKEFVSEGVQN